MSDSLRFEHVELRPAARELTVDGHYVPMGGRAFDLLLALVEHRDRVVSRAELMDRVWPDRVVEENNLAVQVLALRRALGPHAIATVPGRGYRFTLTALDDTSPPPVTSPMPHAHGGRPGAIPALLESLHGRDHDLTVLRSLLQDHRLVTVVGTGGVGKSTLAAAAARACETPLREGVAWVELGATDEPERVPTILGQALALQTGEGTEAVAALAATLRSWELLIVFDGVEHLLDAVAALVLALLAGAPGVRLLVTSQAPLRTPGEHVLRLGTLSVPPAGVELDEALSHGALALFMEHARAADPGQRFDPPQLAQAIELCRQLDGLPLALRLAAARLPSLGFTNLREHLNIATHLLGRGGHDRHHTLVATLDWSHGLLSDDERTVFRRLGIFRGGFSLDSAQAVAADQRIDAWAVADLLATLVDRSLVEVGREDPPRYHLLDSARQYALARLAEAGEMHDLRPRHAQAFGRLFERAERSLWSTPDHIWLARYVPEMENLHQAVTWALEHEPDTATLLIGASGPLVDALTLRHTWRHWFDARILVPRELGENPAGARFWLAGSLNLMGHDHRVSLERAEHADGLFRALGDDQGRYIALCLMVMALSTPVIRSPDALLEEAMAIERPTWPARLRVWGCMARHLMHTFELRHEDALLAAQEGWSLALRCGADWQANLLRNWRAGALMALRRLDEALCDTDALAQQVRRNPMGYASLSLGQHARALLMVGRVAEARGVIVELFALLRSAEWDSARFYCDTWIRLALAEGRSVDALRLIGHADAVCPDAGMQWPHSVAFRERVVTSLRKQLGEAACDACRDEGARLDMESVCAVALTAAGAAPMRWPGPGGTQ